MERPAALRLALLSLVVAVGCGERAGPDLSGEPWPPTLSAPGLLGYMALQADPADVSRLWTEALSWRPEGLASGRPFVVALLDAQVLGGDTALLMPVDDEQAFRASFEAAPTVTALGSGRYRLELAASNELVQLARVAGRMTSAQSPLDIIDALGGPQNVAIPVVLRVEDGYALVVPSVEAASVSRRVLDRLPGVHVDSGASVVVSLDVDRCKTVFQAEIASLQNKLRSVLLGVKGAGLAQIAAAFANRERGADSLGLPVSGEAAWALIEMLGLHEIDAAQLRLDGFGDALVGRGVAALVEQLGGELEGPAGTTGDIPLAAGRESLRIRYVPSSPLRDVLDALTGVAAEDDVISLGFDADLLPAAVAAWLRPLAELAKGEGPPCDRYLDELARLLAPLAGRIVLHVDDPPTLAFSVRAGQTLDFDGLSAWLETLADAAGWRGLPGLEREAGAADMLAGWQAFEDSGMLLVVPPGAEPGSASDRAAATLGTPAAVDDPVLRARILGAFLDISTRGGELLIETRIADWRDAEQ